MIFLKNRPINFHIDSTRVVRVFLALKSTRLFRCLIKHKVESSIISTDSNIMYNIIRKAIMYSREGVWPRLEKQERISWIFTRFIQSYSKLSISEKRRSTAKYLTRSSVRLKVLKKTSMPNPVENFRYIKLYHSISPRSSKSLRWSFYWVKKEINTKGTTQKFSEKNTERWSAKLLIFYSEVLRSVLQKYWKVLCKIPASIL